MNIRAKKRRHFSGVVLAACIGTVFTVLSQIVPAVQLAYAAIWISLIVYCGIAERQSLRLSRTFLLTCGLFLCFFVYCFGCMVLSGKPEYISGYPILLSKALLMYVVGYFMFARTKAQGTWKYILIAYVASACVYGVWAVVTYVPSLSSWLTSQVYLFDDKNSFGQIAGVASLILAATAVYETKPIRRAYLLSGSICLLFAALLMQCRTTLLALFTAIVVLLCCARKKRVLIMVAVFAIIVMCFSPTLQTYVSHALFLDKYQGTNMDTFSSGRLGLWDTAFALAGESPLIGTGSYYVDCFYINTYANVGILGSILVFALWGLRIVNNAKYATVVQRSPTVLERIRINTAALTVFYLVESALEGFPPFGPGACSFLFWMLSGYLDASAQMSPGAAVDAPDTAMDRSMGVSE